jgi:hypothetical protein
MLARIGVVRAWNRHVERVSNSVRKTMHWGRRKLARTGNEVPLAAKKRPQRGANIDCQTLICFA